MINCRSENKNDPVNEYIKNCELDPEIVPIEILRTSALLYKHKIEEDYIYGVKLVSIDLKHMFADDKTPPYLPGNIYYYEESDNFCFGHKVGTHGAGLWALPCHENSIRVSINNTLCVPILVKFPLKSTLVMGNNSIKGKVMKVVSINPKDVEKYIIK